MARTKARRTAGDYQKIQVERGPVYFLDALLGLGVGFRIDGDQLVALGPGVSPLLQQEVDRRAPVLIAILLEAGLDCGVAPRMPASVTTPKSTGEMDVIRKGIANAEQAKKRKGAIIRAKMKERSRQQ